MCLGRQGWASGVERFELYIIAASNEGRLVVIQRLRHLRRQLRRQQLLLTTAFGKAVYPCAVPLKGGIFEEKQSHPS